MTLPTHTFASAAGVFTDEEYLRCIRCGLCASVCPVYREQLIETASPRGLVALFRAIAEGDLSPNPNYALKMYRCLSCEACAAICPSQVRIDDLFVAARRAMADGDLLPEPLQRLGETITACYNISGEDNERRMSWAENLERPLAGLGVDRAEIVYFAGCVSSFFPMSYALPQAMTGILEAAGADYALMGEGEWCCGYPLLLNGQWPQAEALIRHNFEVVRAVGARRLVTTCPSCYHVWKHTCAEISGEPLGFEVLHATELLADLIDVGTLRLRSFPHLVTYHDPCDLGRKSGLYDPPRRVLQGIPGLELVEMADNCADARCCGGGGNLETLDAALSQAVADRRLGQAAETGAQVIATACQQCRRTLVGAVRRVRGKPLRRAQGRPQGRIRVMDVVELVWRNMEV